MALEASRRWHATCSLQVVEEAEHGGQDDVGSVALDPVPGVWVPDVPSQFDLIGGKRELGPLGFGQLRERDRVSICLLELISEFQVG